MTPFVAYTWEVTALLPGATETEFASTSGMDATSMFRASNTLSSREVAEAGYNGMLDGELNVIAGVSKTQRILMALIPVLPLPMRLRAIRYQQEV